MRKEIECNVTVILDIPDCGDRVISEDDLRSMVCNALQSGHIGTGVQLILADVAQESTKGEPVICDTQIDVEWGSIEEV